MSIPDQQTNPKAALPAWLATGGSGAPLGYQQINNLSAAIGLTAPAGAVLAYLQAEGQAVRWRDDGAAPTGTVGMLLEAGLAPWPYTGDLSAILFIATAAGAIVNVAYY